MSRIYFHSEHGEAEVSGAERAYMGGVCGDLFVLSLGLEHDHDSEHCPSPLRRILNPSHYAASLNYTGRQFANTLATALRVGMDSNILIVKGESVDTFSAALNTAYLMGSDAVKLMARLHGQCELHAYVEGPNRAWLAELIRRGLEVGMFRDGMGWSAVVKLLTEHDDCPVVTSFSVCYQFPNHHVAGWTPPLAKYDDGEEYEDTDAWYDLPKAEQWRTAMEGLRGGGGGLELKPDNWQTYYFGDGINGFQLRRIAEELHTAATVPTPN